MWNDNGCTSSTQIIYQCVSNMTGATKNGRRLTTKISKSKLFVWYFSSDNFFQGSNIEYSWSMIFDITFETLVFSTYFLVFFQDIFWYFSRSFFQGYIFIGNVTIFAHFFKIKIFMWVWRTWRKSDLQHQPE